VVLSHAAECDEHHCLEGCAVAALDEQSGILTSGGGGTSRSFEGLGYGAPTVHRHSIPKGDSGGASRFFYTSKIPPTERKLPDGSVNQHPTVKSVKLMRHFVRLITPPKGTVLDPFAGSGTTGVAALREGMGFVGIELDPEHHRVAELRLQTAVSDVFAAIDELDPS
jgi:site-specific DNA-methyltransferase (adenine-specific)